MNSILHTRVYAVHRLTGYGIPKPDASICSATSGRQESMLMRRPSYGFHRSQVRRIRLHGSQRVLGPHVQSVIVATRCKTLPIWRPLQSAHFLTMANQRALGYGSCKFTIQYIQNGPVKDQNYAHV